MRRLLLALFLAAASAPAASAVAVAPADSAVAQVALAPRDGMWEVSYRLPSPVTALRFTRVDRKGRRAIAWKAIDPGFILAAEEGGEVIRRRDGGAFRQVAFRVPPRYQPLDNDYAPFSPFGDGGLLIHTGRFQVCPGNCAALGSRPFWRFRVTPPRGAHVIVHGRRVAEAHFEDRDDGTNIYVGQARAVATANVLAVIDARFPERARRRLLDLLPRLMDLYGAELGRLASRPMLFASYDAAHPGGGFGYQGGTLPEQVFVHLYGRHPSFATAAFAQRLDAFFAHEAAHMYQRYPPLAKPGDAWIHEGGADALAAVALRRLGETDGPALDAHLHEALATCAAALGHAPLERSTAGGDAVYACGFLAQMAADAAARKASGGRCDLFCIWRDFQSRVAAGAPWDGGTFVAAVQANAGRQAARFVHAVAGGTPDDPAAFLRHGLAQAGVPLSERPLEPAPAKSR